MSSIPPGAQKIVRVAGREVGVFNVGGTFFALLNRCPHQGGPLGAGQVVGQLEASRPGEYVFDSTHKLLKCPWHGWEFDMRNGQSWFDPAKMRVRSYPVTVEAGEQIVNAPVGQLLAAHRGLSPGRTWPRRFVLSSKTTTSSSRCSHR